MTPQEETIEILEELEKYLQGVLQRSKEGNKHNPELYICLELQTKTLKQIQALQSAIKALKIVEKLPSVAELHEIWHKTTGIEISLTINSGLKALHQRIWSHNE